MALELRDPTTGKIKPVYLIAGGGIVIFGVVLLMGKGGDSGSTGTSSGSSGSGGVVSGGQSSDITQQLAELNDAIIGLAGGELPEAPGGGGGSNVPVNDTNTSPYYDDGNTYAIPISIGNEPPLIPIHNEPYPLPIISNPGVVKQPAPTTSKYTVEDALAAIKARAIAAGYSGSASSVMQTYQNDLAKGYSIEQIVGTTKVSTSGPTQASPTTTSTSKYPAPTQAQLDAIKARALAAGFNPTPQAILNTYYRYGG